MNKNYIRHCLSIHCVVKIFTFIFKGVEHNHTDLMRNYVSECEKEIANAMISLDFTKFNTQKSSTVFIFKMNRELGYSQVRGKFLILFLPSVNETCIC